MNFRTYIIEKGLSEENYKLASTEYSEAIKPLKEKVTNVEKQLAEITENTDFVGQETLNTELGKIWRIIIANETFCNEYGGISFTDEPATNLYKEIYDKHLEELKEFMYYFIKVANTLFSK